MKLNALALLGLAATTLGNPLEIPEALAPLEKVQLEVRELEPRTAAYSVLGQYAVDLIILPVLSELGIQKILGKNGPGPVDLSESALKAIGSIVSSAIEDSWLSRDKASMTTFVQNSRDYTRKNNTEGLIISQLNKAVEYHEDANELINQMLGYGLKAAPAVQTLMGLWVVFKKEEIALTRDLDLIHNEKDHLEKLEGFRTRLGEFIKSLEAFESSFIGTSNRLYRTRFTKPGNYPCPGCICKRKTVRSYFESRPSESAGWTVRRQLSKTWPFCGKTPTGTLNEHRRIITAEYNAAVKDFRTTKRDDFLTGSYDDLLKTMRDLVTWDADRLINSLFVEDSA
ncbi:hypothetical protein DL764_006108 [Monosporascus ibericus]|uniref:Uncharacterized protein n=1 Tax=Monosporascus ibericus TaxID=155417 RepID=A0A4Q4T5Q2_9PEZI|nr:hypothetical protein DL764_006108 [Monosporascus ibericus]